MKRALTLLVPLALAIPAPALGQYDDLDVTDEGTTSATSNPRFGVGIRAMLSGLFAGSTAGFFPGGGASFIFDARDFRIEALLGLLFVEDAATTFGLGGRFLYVVHKSKSADLGVGAGVGLSHAAVDFPGDDATLFHAEGLVQIRVFLAENAALTGSLGLGLAAGDGPTLLSIGGQLSGTLGLSYFF